MNSHGGKVIPEVEVEALGVVRRTDVRSRYVAAAAFNIVGVHRKQIAALPMLIT